MLLHAELCFPLHMFDATFHAFMHVREFIFGVSWFMVHIIYVFMLFVCKIRIIMYLFTSFTSL